MAIAFHSENIQFNLKNKKAIRQWLAYIVKKQNKIAKNVYYIFCDNIYLYELNILYLNHKTFTDIITFDYSENDFLSADIFISIDQVKENARKYEINFEEELKRVMIHGMLHVVGFDDKTKAQKLQIRKAENKALQIWKQKFHVKH
jgi:probable rRNA maturation factor